QLARDAGVRSLILNHVSRRYSRRQILAEARAVFEPVFVANDFDRFRVVKNMPAELIEQGGPWRRDSGGKRQDHDE
ncbi:MAG: hypothetical protein KDG58_04740, partial [Anaerolineae bacterium]|nr:hypothetical protein [Anaerolineae bacterium]